MPQLMIQLVQDGQVLAVAALEPKTFSTGSKGYFAQIRPTVEGKKHIASINLVEVGSKDKTKK